MAGETDLKLAFMQAMKLLGVWCIRQQVRGQDGPRSVATGEPGMPDLMILLPAPVGVCFIELKAKGRKAGGRTLMAQAEWSKKAGHLGIIVQQHDTLWGAVNAVLTWSEASYRPVRISKLVQVKIDQLARKLDLAEMN